MFAAWSNRGVAMRYVFDPRRWDRGDQVMMGIGTVTGAVVGGIMGYFRSQAETVGGFLAHPVHHNALVFCAVGALFGCLIAYFLGFTAKDDPPDYP